MGFFSNINTNLRDELKKTLVRGYQSSIKVSSHGGCKFFKHIPGATCGITKDDILVITSNMYPDIRYEIDIKDAIDKLYSDMCSQLDISDIMWDEVYIGYYDSYNINTFIDVIKDKLVIRLKGGSRRNPYATHLYNINTYKEPLNPEFKFTGKYEWQLDLQKSPTQICMDLRTSLTSYINQLRDGKISPIDVKKNIEDYIKDLK